jgi:tRNA A-37 threonylcarbamoyl transferase component Bud32
MGWVEIHPKYAALFRASRWDCASSFLSWSGILVNRHRKRTVEQVSLAHSLPSPSGKGDGGEGTALPSSMDVSGGVMGEELPSPPAPLPEGEGRKSFFLKKESGVTYRDLFRNAWHGFGWCATAVREGAILQAVQRAGIGCPEVVALGESGKEAFLLTRDESHMPELRIFLTIHESAHTRARLAETLGREVAKMHDAGFEHPDLFAKHILVSDDLRFCILDWQRARWRKSVSWRLRTRDLALLDATLHDALASDRLRLRCLRAYLSATAQQDAPPLARLARSIRYESARLRTERNLREIGQLPIAEKEQQFVQLHKGRLLVVRSYHEQYAGLADDVARLFDAENKWNSHGTIQLESAPITSNDCDMPAIAHTLFRLQRFGVGAPRLVALCWSATHVHVVTHAPSVLPFDDASAKASPHQRGQLLHQAGELVRRIHEAGFSLPFGEGWSHRLGVTTTGDVVLQCVEPLERRSTPWQEFAPTELNHQQIRLTRTERLRFLSGYLQHSRGKRRVQALLAIPMSASPERQAVG